MPAGFVPIPRRINYGRPSITRLGPWHKGMIYRYVPENFGEQACQDIVNFDVLPNGELKSRPPFVRGAGTIDYADGAVRASVGTTSQWNYVGNYVISGKPIGVFNNGGYIVASDLTGTATGLLWKALAPSGGTWGRPQLYNSQVVAVNQYDGTAYALNQASGASVAGTALSGSTTPGYSESIIYKDRMYVWNPGNTSRVYFSKTANPTTFINDPDTGYFDVNPGDGTTVQAIIATRNVLYIFKDRSSYQLIIPSSGVPTSGQLTLISPVIGTLSNNTLAVYENHVYTATQDAVYEIINGLFTNISYQLGPNPLFYTNADNPIMSVVDDRLLLGNGIVGQSSALVYNFKSRGWSRYSISTSVGMDHYAALSACRVSPFRCTTANQVTDVLGNKYLQAGLMPGRNGPYFYIFDYQFTQYLNNSTTTALYGDYETSSGNGRGLLTCSAQTKDFDGSTNQTASYKRYYAVVVNTYSPDQVQSSYVNDVQPSVSLSFTDHNGNNIADVGANLHPTQSDTFATVHKYAAYDSVKFYTSLRARHIEYDINIYPYWGPISLYSLDVLVKLKQPEQSGQVGG